MVPLGTRMILHDKPGNRKSWGHHGTPVWYIGPSLDHCRCMQCYMPATGIVRITDTLQYIPNNFAFPTTTTKYYLHQAIGEIITIMKYPPKTLPLLSYGDAKQIINHIVHILHTTSQPRLQILPLPPLLPQTQSENLQVQNIPSMPVPALMMEPFLQTPRVQIIQSAPTPPPIMQPSTSLSLDPDPNPWNKKITKYLKSPQIPKARKT